MAKAPCGIFKDLSLSDVFENSQEIVFIHDFKGRILDVSKYAAKTLGYSRAKLKKMNLRDIVQSPSLIKPSFKLLQSKGFAHFQAHAIDSKKNVLTFDLNAHVVECDGKPLIVSFARDRTSHIELLDRLSQSELRFHELFDSSSDCVVIFDLDAKILAWNPAIETLTGYYENEMLGKSIIKRVSSKEHKFLKSDIKKLLDEKSLAPIEISLKMKNGGKRDLWVSFFLMKDSKGHPMSIGAIGRDITERKILEDALRESEREFEALFSSSLDNITLVDLDGHVIAWNPAAEKLTGYKEDEVLGKHISFIYPQSELKRINSYLSKFSSGKNLSPLETRIITKKGEEVWMSLSFFYLYGHNGEVIASAAIGRDITKTRELEQALLESEARYRDLVEESPCAIGITLGSGKTVYLSSAWERVTGWPIKDVIGKKFVLAHPDDYKKVLALNKAVLSGKKSKGSAEYRILTKKGETRWIHHTWNLHKKDGKVDYVRSFVYDITSHKKLEKKYELQRKNLLSIFDGIDEIVYVADPQTHEILYANKKVTEQFGKNVLGKKCYKVLQGRNSICPFCTNDIIFKKRPGKTYIWDYFNKKSQRLYHCVDRAISWPDGRIVRQELAIDITEQKKTKLHHKYAMDTVQEIVVILDTRGKIHYLNNYAQKVLGKKLSAVEGKSWIDLFIPKRDRKTLRKVLKNVPKQGRGYNINSILVKGGKERLISWTNRFVKPEDGNPAQIISFGRDITDSRKEKQKLEDKVRKLEEFRDLARKREKEIAKLKRKTKGSK